MDAAPHLARLLERWEDQEKAGFSVSPAELCPGDPELAARLARLCHFARHMDRLADHLTEPHPEGTGEPPAAGRLGDFRIVRELGRGGMGVVYLAHDERLQRQVALKVMLPHLAANPTARERFLREARAAARISSDHVVAVFEADEIDGTPCIAMQYLRGRSLAEHLKGRRPLAIPEVLRIGREAALGLAAAHRLGLVHRDVKPGNLWLEGDPGVQVGRIGNPSCGEPAASATGGRVKLLDFGLVRPALDAGGAELSGSGAVMGTPAYMAPEQGMAGEVDGRADLFSLGCVLYQLCTGKVPFDRPSVMGILAAIATEEPTPVRELNPDVPESLADLIRRLMAKKPGDRPADASAVADECARMLAADDGPGLFTTVDHVPAAAPRRWWRRTPALVALALVPLLALAVVGWRLWPGGGRSGETVTPAEGLAVRSLRVTRYPLRPEDQDDPKEQGEIGKETFTTRFADVVRVEAVLSEPAHAFLIAFTPDGKHKLLWPADEAGKPDERRAPPREKAASYHATNKGVGFGLDENDKGGTQAFVVVASREALPSFEEWNKGWTDRPWRVLPAARVVYVSDGDWTEIRREGKGRVRGTDAPLPGQPLLRPLCRGLKEAVADVVEGVAFGVQAK